VRRVVASAISRATFSVCCTKKYSTVQTVNISGATKINVNSMGLAAGDFRPFSVPLHFEDLSRADAGDQRVDLDAMQSDAPDALLDAPIDESFDANYALISRYSRLSVTHRSATLEAVRSFSASPASPSGAKRAAFLLTGLAAAAEGDTTAKNRKTWDKTGRDVLLETAVRLVADSGAVSWSPADRDGFCSVLLRMVLNLLESPIAARDKSTRPALARILASVIVSDPAQSLPATTGLIHLLNRYEHVAVPIADILYIMADEFALDKVASDIVGEIARLDPGHLARDMASAKSCATCIGELAERLPKLILSSISLLLSLLDGDSYTMRNGIIHAIGRLICSMRDDPARAETRDSLLDILLDRAKRDVNAFTRSKALQTWSFLAESRAIPHRRLAAVAATASSRLEDKTSAVRRAAAQLLSALLRANPFGPALRLSHFQAKHSEFCCDDQEKDGTTTADSRGPSDGAQTTSIDEIELEDSETEQSTDGEMDADADDEEAGGEKHAATSEGEKDVPEEPIDEQKMKELFYKSAVELIMAVETGLTKAYQMLRSTSISDVSESVGLLVVAVQFQVEAASGKAVRAMLALVLAREANIKSAVIEAYEHLLAPNGTRMLDDKDGALLVANGLIALILGATTGEVACIETLVVELMTKEASIISPAVIAIMWDMFAGKIPGALKEKRVAACIYLGMFAATRPDTLQSRVHILEQVGLNEQDMSYLQWTCVALGRLPAASDGDGRMCQQLVKLVEWKGCDLLSAEQALNAIYRLHPSPEGDVASMVGRMATDIFANASSVPTDRLSRFLFVVGHVAIKQLVRVEFMVGQLRKVARKDEEEEAGAETDKALEYAEGELTLPRTLLGRYGSMVQAICADDFAPAELRASAVLCMAKLMCVKSSFCESNLQLLFTVLERASEASVRANAITALGDLAFRFPNMVEPWSPRIYMALEDKHVRVRKNALMALTHLILNDMVKVKGQMVGLALRVLDPEERIADLARLFFHELSRKSANAIYNLLPDTVSCLSRREDVPSADVKRILAFLVGFVEKGWQAEGVVDKLCQRFRTAQGVQESRELAYCIAHLTLTDRCVGALEKSFKLYAPVLVDDEVYGSLVAAVSKARKASVPDGRRGTSEGSAAGGSDEVKSRADELLLKIEKQRNRSGADDGDDRAAM
jgi:condensin complex subunit 1